MQERTPGLSTDEIDQIMRMVDGAAVDYVSWETEDLKVVVARDTYVPGLAPGREAETAPAPAAVVVADRPAPAVVEPAPAAQAPLRAEHSLAAGEREVLAPMTGICYLRPDPASPAYVEVGGSVAEGDTVALVEVMKTFAAVTAPAAGSVVAVLVEAGSEVTLGQPMFIIKEG